MEKINYEVCEIEVIVFDEIDVICQSDPFDGEWAENA
jgi:hypothetical protein